MEHSVSVSRGCNVFQHKPLRESAMKRSDSIQPMSVRLSHLFLATYLPIIP